MKADATDLPPPAQALIAPEPAEAVTALYQAHALGLIRLAVVMLGGSVIVTNAVYFRVKTKESGKAWDGRYGFAEYSTRTGKLVRILGYWTVKPAGYWFTQVLWSSPSGRVLIAIIPDGRIGVINGNEFTPLNMPPVSGAVMDLALGAQAGAW